jgi:hypothetical protein
MIPRFYKKQIKQSKQDYSAGLQQTVCLWWTKDERGGAKLRRTNYRPLRVHLVYRGCGAGSNKKKPQSTQTKGFNTV